MIIKDKSVLTTTKLQILRSIVEIGTITPDPQRVQPLCDLPSPHNSKSMKRALGLFYHYFILAKWLLKFSDKILLLIKTEAFPLSVEVFHDLKKYKTQLSQV